MNDQKSRGDVPIFTPPQQNGGYNSQKTFTPPAAPTFTPPGQAPTFTPPGQAPTFTPPGQAPTFQAPVFTPPTPSHATAACYYHHDEVAVATCARCGKHICQDCFDNYGVTSGEYAGKALCYDCCQQLVANNVAELTANKAVIKRQFILSCVGMGIGFLWGFIGTISGGFFSALITGLLSACVGGVFLSAVKVYFSMLWETIKTGFNEGIVAAIIGFVVACFVLLFRCVITTVSNTYHYITYLKKTSGFIEADSAALQQMKDYMEYTLVRSRNRGVDLNTLMSQQGGLANNSYARMVQTQGEEGAEAHLRQCVATINENGEIIRSFAA